MNKIKNISKNSKVLFFYLVSLLIILLISIYVKSRLMETVCSLFGISIAVMQMKKKSISQILGMIYSILYAIISFANFYYGEVIVSVITFIIFSYGTISWYMHMNRKEKEVIKNENISNIEKSILGVLSIIFFIVFYMILSFFKTPFIILSSLSVVTSLCSIYLVARRYKSGFVFYILNDVILIFLWSILAFSKDITIMPMAITPILYLVNDIYAFVKW